MSRKAESARPQIVGVIASVADLQRALRMTTPPDFFELRLDALANLQPASAAKLRAPIIATARRAREGAVQNLSAPERRCLLARFAEIADYVDIELRSRRSYPALQNHRKILSFHDFQQTPPLSDLRRKLHIARASGAEIFKVATRVDDESQLERLLQFFDEAARVIPIAAMGIGALGRKSRIELARRGSILNYGYITRPQASGQLSVTELRRLLRR